MTICVQPSRQSHEPKSKKQKRSLQGLASPEEAEGGRLFGMMVLIDSGL